MPDISRSEAISNRQERIAILARQMPDRALTSLSHHIDIEWMMEAYRRTRKDGAVGVDGQTAEDYAVNLEENLGLLIDRVKSLRYRAPSVRRVHIPKGNGQTRPLGIPTFEDKVLQRAVVMVLEPVYENDFYDFSYGFRPGRSAHRALEVLNDGLLKFRGGWVLDVDIKSFFDTLDHRVLRDLLKQRVTDGIVVRHIGKWLNAGVLDGGVVTRIDKGTPQGGVISPLLANIYLHEVLDRWWIQDVLPRLQGKAFLIRYADDFVCVFKSKEDAENVKRVLAKRFARFNLTLHPEKTKLVDFRPPGASKAKPGTFDFLGFTFYWGKTRKGRPWVKRKTARKRFTRALKAMNQWMRTARTLPISQQAATLRRKLLGHFNYYGLRGNSFAIGRYRYEVLRLWFKWLNRRSQRLSLTWSQFMNMVARVRLPPALLKRGQA